MGHDIDLNAVRLLLLRDIHWENTVQRQARNE